MTGTLEFPPKFPVFPVLLLVPLLLLLFPEPLLLVFVLLLLVFPLPVLFPVLFPVFVELPELLLPPFVTHLAEETVSILNWE